MAGDMPREKLKELVEKNGDSLIEDRDRCEGLLKDYCGGHRREISALVGALEERIPLELRSSWQSAMTPEAMRARLVQRLEDNRGLAPEIASYAVDTWSYALGVGLSRISDRVQDVPAVGVAAGTTVQSALAKGGLSNQNKAIVGGVGLLAVAAMAFALLHHPQPAVPAPPEAHSPAQVDQHGQAPTPAPILNGQDKTPAPAPTKDAQTGNNTVADPGGGSGSQPGKSSPAISAPASVVVRLNTDFDSDNATVGEVLPATVVTPLSSSGNVVVQRGAPAQLKVVRIDKSGKISGKAQVELALVGLTAHGKLVRISGSSRQMDGPLQGAQTAKRTGVMGAIKGHLFHHAGTGAVAGAGAGDATGPITSHPAPVKISAETVFQFRLPRGIPAGS
jgi:hypothetical protein